ncbi:unnamed protein product, partial [Musa acuminata subsp. burmannicoides]
VLLQAGVLQQGPWGGNGGKTWNMRPADHISNVKIHYNDAVFAFDFTFTVDGKKKTIHVGGDAPQYNEITLEEDEYFTFISGYFKTMWTTDVFITQLTLETNKGNSVSAGNAIGSHFSLNLEDEGKILGFFGREGSTIDAIEAIGAGVLQQGPWGGNGGKTWNMRQADHISNVKIHYNDAVFAFDFTFTVDGKKKTIHVGGDAPQYNEITLEEDEYFTFISGYFKTMWTTDVFITQLTLETNKGNSVSAGNTIGSHFSLNLEDEGKILGFFGREGSTIDAIEAIGAGRRMVKVGPWGGNGGMCGIWDKPTTLPNFESITEITLWGWRLPTFLTNSHTYKRGTTTGASKEIILEEDEYFTSISGYFHALSNYQRHAIVMLLTLDTNKGASISVGNKTGSSFALTLEEGSRILGFFGRAGTAIDAIGIHCSLPN